MGILIPGLREELVDSRFMAPGIGCGVGWSGQVFPWQAEAAGYFLIPSTGAENTLPGDLSDTFARGRGHIFRTLF